MRERERERRRMLRRAKWRRRGYAYHEIFITSSANTFNDIKMVSIAAVRKTFWRVIHPTRRGRRVKEPSWRGGGGTPGGREWNSVDEVEDARIRRRSQQKLGSWIFFPSPPRRDSLTHPLSLFFFCLRLSSFFFNAPSLPQIGFRPETGRRRLCGWKGKGEGDRVVIRGRHRCSGVWAWRSYLYSQ